jgi:hypothetical protein
MPVPRAVVDRSSLDKQRIPACIAAIGTTCTTGATSAAVTASPTCSAALTSLKGYVATAGTSLTTYNNARKALTTAASALRKDYQITRTAYGTYMTCVDELAGGDASVITAAGCSARVDSTLTAAVLGTPADFRFKPWKTSATAKLQWSGVPGAANYVVELNPTPQTPTGPWSSAGNASPRVTKVVTAATPGAQMLARVAAVRPDGTQGEWSDPLLVTTKA